MSGYTSTSTNIECSYHQSLIGRTVPAGKSKCFTGDIEMIDKAEYKWTTSPASTPIQMPNPNGGKYGSMGNTGDGFAKITYVP